MKAGRKRPSAAMVVALIALVVALTGTAYALGVNTVGSRQLKGKAVTTAKLANGAVTAAQVKNHSLVGGDIDLSALGTVPTATHIESVGNSSTVDGHAASCPAGTTLIRGVCFDTKPSGPVSGVLAAAGACAARGGYLPTPQELARTRAVLPLGDGTEPHAEFTDSYNSNTQGKNWWTTVASENGLEVVLDEETETKTIKANFEFICTYPLVR